MRAFTHLSRKGTFDIREETKTAQNNNIIDSNMKNNRARVARFLTNFLTIFGKYLFGRRFEIWNFRNICSKMSCLPALS